MPNPFSNLEPFEVYDNILRKGKHLVSIDEVDGSASSRNGYAQVIVRLSNSEGSITDYLTLTTAGESFGLRRMMNLLACAGLGEPSEEDVSEATDAEGFRLSEGFLGRLIGKRVIVIVDEEPSIKDASRMRSTVKGYREATPGSDVTDAAYNAQFSDMPKVSAGRDRDDIPF